MRYFYLKLFIALLFLSHNTYASPKSINKFIEETNIEDSATEMSKRHNKKISSTQQELLNYMNSIKTMTANFIQIAPDGTSSEGKFFLSRPGKLRWQYEPPVPILIIINAKNLLYYDYELDEVTYTDVDQIMGAFLTEEKIDFSKKEMNIENIQKYGLIKLKITNDKKLKEKQNLKEMIITFNIQPKEIKKIEFIDNDNKKTTVSFQDVHLNVPLGKELFNFKNIKGN